MGIEEIEEFQRTLHHLFVLRIYPSGVADIRSEKCLSSYSLLLYYTHCCKCALYECLYVSMCVYLLGKAELWFSQVYACLTRKYGSRSPRQGRLVKERQNQGTDVPRETVSWALLLCFCVTVFRVNFRVLCRELCDCSKCKKITVCLCVTCLLPVMCGWRLAFSLQDADNTKESGRLQQHTTIQTATQRIPQRNLHSQSLLLPAQSTRPQTYQPKAVVSKSQGS